MKVHNVHYTSLHHSTYLEMALKKLLDESAHHSTILRRLFTLTWRGQLTGWPEVKLWVNKKTKKATQQYTCRMSSQDWDVTLGER